MAQSSNGLEVPEKTNGGSIPGCDDEIGGGVLEQVGEMERVFPLKEVLEMIERKCQDYDQGAAGSGKGGISLLRHVFSGKGWELKELRMLINRNLSGYFGILYPIYDHVSLIKIILDGGAARGSEGGFAHLTQCEVDEVMLQTNALLDLILIGNSRNFAGRQSNPLISSLSKGCEGDEFERWINVMLNGAAARGGKLDQPEVDKLARQINKILDTLSEGGTAHLAGTSRPGNRATEQSHREPQNRATESHNFGSMSFASYENLRINWGAAKGNEVGNDSMPLNNMFTSSGKYPPGFAPAGTSRPQNRATESHISGGGRLEQGEDRGNKVCEELLHSISFNIPEHLVNCHYRLAFPYNGLLCQDAAGGNKVGEMEIKGRVFPLKEVKEVLEMIECKCQDYDSAPLNNTSSSPANNPDGSAHSRTSMQQNRPTESFCIDIVKGDNAYMAEPQSYQPDSAPLNNMSSSPANNPDGSAHSRTSMQQNRPTESHSVNIDEGDNAYLAELQFYLDSAPLNNMSSRPANNPDGSSHSRSIMQENRPSSDINDGENQKQKLKFLELSMSINAIMFTAAVVITSSLPKYLLGIGLVLVVINFVFLGLRAFFSLKCPKLTNVAFAFNMIAFFLFVATCLSKSDLWK